jgi:hypothetical protein
LYSDPLASGEHEGHGWQDTWWLRREWEENGLLGEDRGTLMARTGNDTLGFVAWRRRSYGPHSPCWIVNIALEPEPRATVTAPKRTASSPATWHDCVFYGVLRDEVDLGSGETAGATGRPSET